MRVIVAGIGIQGEKRRHVAATDCVATCDPVAPGADYRRIEDVPLDQYDAALLCVPDAPKVGLISYLAGHGKHILVEKPLVAADQSDLADLVKTVERAGVVCYTAYNHRFEPHLVRLRGAIESGVFGKIYRARFFYGNGTARNVRNSPWRDRGAGVLPDLGSHLLDTLLFLFGSWPDDLRVWSAQRFENRAFDHVICGGTSPIHIELEMSLLSWKNHFVAEVYGQDGSAHIESLCKWGPTTFSLRKRVLPSARPPEESVTLVQEDPTWGMEYDHFKTLCANGGNGNIENDLKINRVLNGLVVEAMTMRTV